jgi:hypothetical protein
VSIVRCLLVVQRILEPDVNRPTPMPRWLLMLKQLGEPREAHRRIIGQELDYCEVKYLQHMVGQIAPRALCHVAHFTVSTQRDLCVRRGNSRFGGVAPFNANPCALKVMDGKILELTKEPFSISSELTHELDCFG